MDVRLDLRSLDWRLEDGSEKLVCEALALRLFSNSPNREIIIFNPEGFNWSPRLLFSSRLCVSDILKSDITDRNCAMLNYNNTKLRCYPTSSQNAKFQNYKADPEIAVYVEKGAFLKGSADILSKYRIGVT